MLDSQSVEALEAGIREKNRGKGNCAKRTGETVPKNIAEKEQGKKETVQKSTGGKEKAIAQW